MAQHPARPALILLVGCLAAAAGAGAQAIPPVERPMPHMQAMNRVFNLLKEQARDPSQNRSSIALVADLEWSTFSAKEAVPLRSAILPDEARRAMVDGYRRQFLKLLREELDLEEALLNNDNRAASALVAAIEVTENEGHDKFR
jgi:hypothetical protein